jgi:phage terminase large subunit
MTETLDPPRIINPNALKIQLPHNWKTRPHQIRLWRHMVGDGTLEGMRGKRGVACWHRRAGKDEVCLHIAPRSTMIRPGNYWHMLPKATQARKAIWEAVNEETGKRRIDEAFPLAIRNRTRDHEMAIDLVTGATWQVVGSDNYNHLVGASPVGITFSEFSLSDPDAWTYLRPILKRNGGWAAFIFTARGKNHAYDLLNTAQQRMREGNPLWFGEIQTVDDTGIFTAQDIEEERADGMDEDMIQSEYYCSFDAALPGAYYGKLMRQARAQGRIGKVPIAPGIPVQTWWDLGYDDSMTIWLTQTIVREIRCIGYYENSGFGFPHYADWLDKFALKHGLRYLDHNMPHDIEVHELGRGKSRKDECKDLGIWPIRVSPQHDLQDGIAAVRRILPQVWFDETPARRPEDNNTKRGVQCLTDYTKEWDEKAKVFKSKPDHNWACHGADAFRVLAMMHPGRAKLNRDEEKSGLDRYTRKRRAGTWMGS